MAAWMETYRGVVFPWHCDQFGHMNVRWYAHIFDDAAFHIWPLLGFIKVTRIRIRLDLPAPFGPSRPNMPSRMSRLTSFRA